MPKGRNKPSVAGRTRKKAANTVIRNSASDKPMPMPIHLSSNSQLLQVWVDWTGLHPKSRNQHVDTKKGEWDTSIKGETNEDTWGGWPQRGGARKAKLAHVVFPVGTTTRTIHLCPDLTFQAHSLQMMLWEAFLNYESNFILELL